MGSSFIDIEVKNKLRILISILFIEYLTILFSGISFTSLQGDNFFSIGVDPFFWMIYLAKIPQTILAYKWLALLCDTAIIAGFIMLIYDPLRNRVALILFFLLLIFYMTHMGLIGSRNYMTGFFLVLIPLLFYGKRDRQISFEAVRYFLLFFYVSAAIIKLFQSNIYDLHYFSNILINQFTPYYLEQNFSIRTDLNQYLIGHPLFARIFFLAGTLLELIPIAGFFTKKFDTKIAMLILIFHFTNWFVMDIAPIGQIAFISMLFFSKTFALHSASKN